MCGLIEWVPTTACTSYGVLSSCYADGQATEMISQIIIIVTSYRTAGPFSLAPFTKVKGDVLSQEHPAGL